MLIIDNELHPETLAHRIKHVAHAMDVGNAAIDALDVICLRGKPIDINELDALIRTIRHREYQAVVLDAIYKLYPEGMSENDNALMSRFYSTIDHYAGLIGSAFICVHHSSRGPQGNKSITDVGAGAGSQSRAVDTHLVLREHEENDCMVVDAVARSWAPLTPFVIRWEYPLWRIDNSIDVTRIKRDNRGGRSRKLEEKAAEKGEDAWTPERFAAEFVCREPLPQSVLIARANTRGISHRTIAGLIAEAQRRALIYRHRTGRTTGVAFSTEKPTSPAEVAQRESAHTTPHTPQKARRKNRRDSKN